MTHKRKAAQRFAFDARGMPRWDQRGPTGEYRPQPKDSPELRALKADALSLEHTHRQRVLQHPYGSGMPVEKTLKARSTLDYMRALSEAIKAHRKTVQKDAPPESSPRKRIKRVLHKVLKR